MSGALCVTHKEAIRMNVQNWETMLQQECQTHFQQDQRLNDVKFVDNAVILHRHVLYQRNTRRHHMRPFMILANLWVMIYKVDGPHNSCASILPILMECRVQKNLDGIEMNNFRQGNFRQGNFQGVQQYPLAIC